MNVDTQADSYQIMLGICQIYAMFVCFLTLSLLKLYRNELHAWKILDRNKTIWDQRKMQYQFSKENMDLINRKFHDMKHQLAAISQMENADGRKAAVVQELEDMMYASDSYAQTGNEALDTILTEKGLYCGAHDIRWTCVADGSFLNFMDVVDLYTLMGNALDNAVESVEKSEDPEKRFISVNIRKEKSFALIQIKNHMEGRLQFRENLPVTSKADTDSHGFGMKSIKTIVEKYHGTMTVSTEDNTFTLNILLPLD
jgi:sensor histidine kinase regulating citrate/malate metabolism